MLKLSVLLLVGTWLSFPRDFLHQKFTHKKMKTVCGDGDQSQHESGRTWKPQ